MYRHLRNAGRGKGDRSFRNCASKEIHKAPESSLFRAIPDTAVRALLELDSGHSLMLFLLHFRQTRYPVELLMSVMAITSARPYSVLKSFSRNHSVPEAVI